MHMYIYNMPKDASKDYSKTDIEDVFHIDSVDEKINGSRQLTVIIDSSYLVKPMKSPRRKGRKINQMKNEKKTEKLLIHRIMSK